MKKFEYRYVQPSAYSEQWLNEIGAEGWEFAWANNQGGLWFKREIPQIHPDAIRDRV
jgi:hypothetical protein